MNTVFKLRSVIDYSDDECKRNLFEESIGYYSSIDTVMKQIGNLSSTGSEFIMFLVDEYELDNFSLYGDEDFRWVRTCQYKIIDGEIVLIHETHKDWAGRVEGEYDYKRGDIIEYLDFRNIVRKCIVGYPPLTVDEAKERGLHVDSLDDSYLVYLLGNGDTHEHIATVNILGYADVTPDEFKQYKDKLKERLSEKSCL